MNNYNLKDTICALATAPGQAAIAVIRISGKAAFTVVEKIFIPKAKNAEWMSQKIYFGKIMDDMGFVDEVLVSVFRNPHSYTGEDVVEISCHGSIYIQQRILQALSLHGLRLAEPGEFTLRAFLNNKLDLSQAEAVADLIASETKVAHQLASSQMRGGFSEEIKTLRSDLIHFAALLELELDFAEEDVEFADRKKLMEIVDAAQLKISMLLSGFELGNILKNGIPVVIAGKPNVGKSTLLNVLLNDDKAIVSEIAGTTRDIIEDEIIIDGINFRFIDTAGLRETNNSIEKTGIEKAYQKINNASILIYVFDLRETSYDELKNITASFTVANPAIKIITVVNKCDLLINGSLQSYPVKNLISLSAKNKTGIEELKMQLVQLTGAEKIQSRNLVTNARHASALKQAAASLKNFTEGINKGLTSDLLASEIRYALNSLAEITGEITTENLLENIFSKFCIGK